jgi:hypothetical protein
MAQGRQHLLAATGKRTLADLQRWLNENVAPDGVEYDHRTVRKLLDGMDVPLYPRAARTWKWFYERDLMAQSPDLARRFLSSEADQEDAAA